MSTTPNSQPVIRPAALPKSFLQQQTGKTIKVQQPLSPSLAPAPVQLPGVMKASPDPRYETLAQKVGSTNPLPKSTTPNWTPPPRIMPDVVLSELPERMVLPSPRLKRAESSTSLLRQVGSSLVSSPETLVTSFGSSLPSSFPSPRQTPRSPSVSDLELSSSPSARSLPSSFSLHREVLINSINHDVPYTERSIAQPTFHAEWDHTAKVLSPRPPAAPRSTSSLSRPMSQLSLSRPGSVLSMGTSSPPISPRMNPQTGVSFEEGSPLRSRALTPRDSESLSKQVLMSNLQLRSTRRMSDSSDVDVFMTVMSPRDSVVVSPSSSPLMRPRSASSASVGSFRGDAGPLPRARSRGSFISQISTFTDWGGLDDVPEEVQNFLTICKQSTEASFVQELLRTEGSSLLSLCDAKGRGCLHYAVSGQVVSALLTAGADPGDADNDGYTPLHVYARSGRADAANAILSQKGCNINAAVHESQNRPAHLAAKHGHVDVLSLLIAAGANVNLRAKDGSTPLSLAVGKGHHECVRVLMEKGAKYDIQLVNQTVFGTPAASLRAKKGSRGALDSVTRE